MALALDAGKQLTYKMYGVKLSLLLHGNNIMQNRRQ
jgi:hypothetical protein